jgi:hypothetical protein
VLINSSQGAPAILIASAHAPKRERHEETPA